MQKINDLLPKIKQHTTAIQSAFARVLERGCFILGPELENFEKQFANYLQARHCLGVANGTDAIELSLRALGIKAGDRVATVANAGMYASTAILTIGAVPLFMDVNINTHNTTLIEVIAAVASGVRAVIVTHLYGLAVEEIESIAAYCGERGVLLLEDCAQAHGAKINSKHVGTFGDIASFSFYPTKNLGAFGDGGAIVTNNSTLAERVKLLRQYGWTEKYKVEMLGARNSRLDELQAAFLLEMFPFLQENNIKRRQVATCYSERISHPKIVTMPIMDENYVAHLYVIRCGERQSLRSHLKEAGILTDVHYPIPDHKQPVFCKDFSTIKLPQTEQLAREILTLPCYPEMNDADVQQVITTINAWQL